VHCRHHALQLQRDREELRAAGDVVLIGMGTPAHANNFRAETGTDFRMLLSRDKAAYRAFDLKRSSALELFTPGSVLKGLARLRGGGVGKAKGGNLPLRAPEQDWHQLGGAFVIAPDGEITWAHPNSDVADNATSDEIIAALRPAAGRTSAPR